MIAERKIAGLEIGESIWGMVKTGINQTVSTVKAGAQWAGGALQGEFNQQATVGQIVVDAVISMFPVAGEITAARDATAIGFRMHESEAALNDKWEWVSLVLCLLAVVPVMGGVLKGVGRLVARAARKSENLVKLGQDVLAFLRKMGYGDATQWLKALDFAKYQGDILNAVNELTKRISDAAKFIQQRMGAMLPQRVQNTLQALPQSMALIQGKAQGMVPKAIQELNDNLNKVRQHITDGSYIAPITVASKKSQVYVTEGRLVSQKVIVGHIEHPPASLSQYRHQEGWPDLEVIGTKNFSIGELAEVKEHGHLWPINTFSAKAPMAAHTVQPGEVLYRVLDKTGGKHLQDSHRAGDCWTPHHLKNGQEFRTKAAVMHGWNANGFIEVLSIPSKAQLEKMGIVVPGDWQGLRTWRGGVGGQLDIVDKIKNGLKNTHTWLEGGGVQDFIDWSHPHNAPIKEYLLRTVQPKPTGWTDLQLPVNPDINTPYVVTLPDLERSAKISQEGYVLRGAATVAKQTNNGQEEK